MTEQDLQKHDWDAVGDALADLLSYTEENEAYASNLIAALNTVRDSLPE